MYSPESGTRLKSLSAKVKANTPFPLDQAGQRWAFGPLDYTDPKYTNEEVY